MLECAWRVSNWAAMKEALVQVSSVPSQWGKRVSSKGLKKQTQFDRKYSLQPQVLDLTPEP